jgi:TolA-binding protein
MLQELKNVEKYFKSIIAKKEKEYQENKSNNSQAYLTLKDQIHKLRLKIEELEDDLQAHKSALEHHIQANIQLKQNFAKELKDIEKFEANLASGLLPRSIVEIVENLEPLLAPKIMEGLLKSVRKMAENKKKIRLLRSFPGGGVVRFVLKVDAIEIDYHVDIEAASYEKIKNG